MVIFASRVFSVWRPSLGAKQVQCIICLNVKILYIMDNNDWNISYRIGDIFPHPQQMFPASASVCLYRNSRICCGLKISHIFLMNDQGQVSVHNACRLPVRHPPSQSVSSSPSACLLSVCLSSVPVCATPLSVHMSVCNQSDSCLSMPVGPSVQPTWIMNTHLWPGVVQPG